MQNVQYASDEQLLEMKGWLTHENMRIESEKEALIRREKEFDRRHRMICRKLKALNERCEMEQKQLNLEKQLFKQKWDILENAYKELHEEQRQLEYDKQRMIQERESYRTTENSPIGITGSSFFKGVNNSLALKKRYRDLIKIFHPDNVAGDKDTIQLINQEFNDLQNMYL
ncbi:MAG: hypothetical protein GX567_03500 [Clostridia bacterium]|nr:hypothetical protein [Clostridia bacterium]